MSQITTHILDTSIGAPAAEVEVQLQQDTDQGWHQIATDKTNGDGRIDIKELRLVFKEMGTKMSKRKLRMLMKSVDQDGSGALDYEEFIGAVLQTE